MKIIVCDIDSSMIKDDVVNSINKYISKGNKIIICTNKSISYIADLMATVSIDCEYYICNGGAVVFDRYYNVLYRKDIKQELVRPIINMLDDDDNILESFVDTSHGFTKDTSKLANGIVARYFDEVKANMIVNTICLKFPDIYGYNDDNWLNILDKEVSKKKSLEYIINTYHLNKEDIIILGKSVEDLDMMKEFKSYNYKNCCEDIKKYSSGEINDLKTFIDNFINVQEKIEFDAIYDNI